MVESPLSSETLERLSAVLTESLGLSFHGDRLEQLQNRIIPVTEELKFNSIHDCVDALLSSPLTRTQIETLAKHLTVGETYFFRDPGVFQVLEKQILPPLIEQRRSTTRTLKIWCAACCTGEEAYSLAMLVDFLVPDWKEWNISILATDLNAEFIERAKIGMYSERSIRNVPDAYKSLYLKKATAANSKKYEVEQRLKSLLSFLWMNLIDASSAPPLDTPVDIIFCRNVFVYFAPAQTRKVLSWLSQNLADDGYLFLAPNEVFSASSDFEIVNIEDVMTLKKKGSVRGVAAQAGEDDLAEASPRVSQTRIPIQTDDDPNNFLLMCRSAVRQGNFDEAARWCERAMEKEPLNPSAYYLMGKIAQQQDNPQQAVTAMKRVLFLEPEFVMAHFTLANLMLQDGRPEQANKHFRAVLRSLDTMNGLEGRAVLPESDGITVATMRAIVGAVLEDYWASHPTQRQKEKGKEV